MTRIGWEPTGPLAKPQPKPKRRGHADPVTPELYDGTMQRDGYRCMAPVLADQHDAVIDACAGPAGMRAVLYVTVDGPVYDLRALTIEHVKLESRMGRRAESRPDRVLVLCWHHNVDGWANTHKDWERDYLRSLYPAVAA